MAHRCTALIGLVSFLGFAAVAVDWETDFAKARETAAHDGKFILIDFTGSDWCGWCMRLERDVFTNEVFKEYARKNLVLLRADFPREQKLPKKLVKQNKAMARQYRVRGYPTVLLALPDGTEVARSGYREVDAEKYVAYIESLLAPLRDRLPKPATAVSDPMGSNRPALEKSSGNTPRNDAPAPAVAEPDSVGSVDKGQ